MFHELDVRFGWFTTKTLHEKLASHMVTITQTVVTTFKYTVEKSEKNIGD